jgi:hypothetical protein
MYCVVMELGETCEFLFCVKQMVAVCTTEQHNSTRKSSGYPGQYDFRGYVK